MSNYTKIFKCELSREKNMVSYKIGSNNKATIEFLAIDYKNIKLFFQLLRSSLNEIQENGIKYINQYINIDEWKYFEGKKTSWKISDNNDNEYLIECPIEDALENIGIGFGIDKILQM